MLSLVVFLIVFIVIGFTIFMDCKKRVQNWILIQRFI